VRLTIKIATIYEQVITLIILTLVFLYDVFGSIFGFLDELIALLSLVVIIIITLLKGKIHFYRKEYYIILFLNLILIIGLLSNYVAYKKGYITDLSSVFGDMINFFKAFIVYFGIRILSNNFDAQKVFNKLSKYTEIIFYFLFLLLIADFIFKIYPQRPRYGVHAFELFFKHASRYSFAFAFSFLILLPKYYKRKRGLLLLILFVGMLSLRVKYFGFVLFGFVLFFYGKKLFKIPKRYFLYVTVGLGLVMVWLFWDWLSMYFSIDAIEKGWSRGVILYYSFTIGDDFFPLGTGFGTYSCYYSGLNYSWVYGLYGIDHVYGMSRVYWGFLADQYWPMVLGQFGYIGFFSMIFVLYNYFTLFLTQIKLHLALKRFYYYYLAAILGLLLLLIDSTTDAIFTQQRAVVMFSFFALILNLTKKKQNE